MIYLPIIETRDRNIEVPAQMKAAIQDPSYKFLVAFSGGKDSVAMVLYLLDLGVTRDRMTLHHHEVDGGSENLWDWPCTPSYCQRFADAFGIDLLFSFREGGIDREMLRTNEGLQDVLYQAQPGGDYVRLESREGNSSRHKFPAISGDPFRRWCSSVVKIDVFGRVMTNNPDYAEGKFVVCTGERRQESKRRSGYAELEMHRSSTKSGSREVWAWRPVIDFLESDVWGLFENYKVQPHPCYELGWSRCSCQTCVFSSPNTWASIAVIAPWKIDEFEVREDLYGHTLHKGRTIREVVARGTSFIREEQLERWGAEAMSEFCSPIFVEEWVEPAGAYGVENSGAV